MNFSAVRSWVPAEQFRLLIMPTLAVVSISLIDRQRGDAVPMSVQEGRIAELSPSTTTDSSAALAGDRWPDFQLDQVIQLDPFTPPPMSPAVETGGTTAQQVAAAPPEDTSPVASQSPPKFEVIYSAGGDRLAVANTQVVRPGDRLNGWRIVRITESEVVVEAH